MPNWVKLRDDFPITKKYAYLANAAIAHMLSDKGIVISNELEFSSSNLPWINKNPINIKFVKATDHNKILIKNIVKMVDQNDKASKTVVTSHVQYSTGFRQDLEELGKLTKQKGLYFVVNPTQSLGALYINVKDFGIDFMASNGHKWMLSCFGIGTIYIKGKYLRDIENFKPSFFSQFGQKRRENFDSNMRINMSSAATKFELATPHFPNIIALNAAVRYISKIGIRHIEKRILNLTDYLIDNLQKMKLEILSPIEERKYRSGIILFKARKKSPIDTVIELGKKSKIIVSARGKGFYNNEDDIDKLITSLKRILQ